MKRSLTVTSVPFNTYTFLQEKFDHIDSSPTASVGKCRLDLFLCDTTFQLAALGGRSLDNIKSTYSSRGFQTQTSSALSEINSRFTASIRKTSQDCSTFISSTFGVIDFCPVV